MSITVEITDEALTAVDAATRAERVSAGDIVDRAVRRYLLVRGFLQAPATELPLGPE
jgi:hypothetical protein